MLALRELQRGFARRVLALERDTLDGVAGGVLSATERMAIYRNTSRTVLTEALRLSFPAVDALVGTDFFDMAAARFIPVNPPRGGCLNDYGAGFPGFLAAMPETAGLPYLRCVADFEWVLAAVAVAPDAPVMDAPFMAPSGLARHAAHNGDGRFAPHPSVRFLMLRYPGDLIADAVLAGDDRTLAALDVAEAPRWLIVHRVPDGVTAEPVDRVTFDRLEGLFADAALNRIDDAAPHEAGPAEYID